MKIRTVGTRALLTARPRGRVFRGSLVLRVRSVQDAKSVTKRVHVLNRQSVRRMWIVSLVAFVKRVAVWKAVEKMRIVHEVLIAMSPYLPALKEVLVLVMLNALKVGYVPMVAVSIAARQTASAVI